MKTCLKCNEPYANPDDAFHKDKSRKDGYRAYCKKCIKEKSLEYYYHKHPKLENKCIDCGINIDHLHPQSIRCEGCRTLNIRANNTKRERIRLKKLKDSVCECSAQKKIKKD